MRWLPRLGAVDAWLPGVEHHGVTAGSRSTARVSASARLVALLLAAVWMSLAIVKICLPRGFASWLESSFSISDRSSLGLAMAVACAEGMLAVGAAAAAMVGHRLRGLFLLSWAAGLVAVGVTLLAPSRVSCGCFGALGRPSTFHRLAVAGVIQWLSWEAYLAFRLGAAGGSR